MVVDDCYALEFLQVLQGILDQPQEGSGALERQSVRAKALLMLAKVYKVRLLLLAPGKHAMLSIAPLDICTLGLACLMVGFACHDLCLSAVS